MKDFTKGVLFTIGSALVIKGVYNLGATHEARKISKKVKEVLKVYENISEKHDKESQVEP